VPFDYACAQYSSSPGTSYCERYVLGEGAAPLERPIALPASHVRTTTRGAALRIHALVTRLLRASARALYLFPVLVVVKIVLFFQDNPWSDYITVGFVVLVALFFAFFALTVLSYAIVGPRSKRAALTRLVFAPPPANDLEGVVASLASREAVSTATRARGRVEAGLAPGEPVLVEEWSRGEQLARFVEGRSFAILPDDAASMPCIVEIAAAPVFVARYSDDEADERDDPNAAALTVAGSLRRQRGTPEPAPRSRCVLRQGQRVAIAAARSEPASRVEDRRLLDLIAHDGAADPYRGAETPGIVVRSTVEEPIVIQLLD
jgi:hypothetical protein